MIAVAPYFIETALNEDGFSKWSEDSEAVDIIRKNFEGKEMMSWVYFLFMIKDYRVHHSSFLSYDFRPDEAALKLINVLNSRNGSVWLIKPKQMQPFNVPDCVLPKTKW